MLLSCRQEVLQEHGSFDTSPTVNAILIEGDTLKVNVSLAEKLDSIQLNFVDNAAVALYVNGLFAEQLYYANSGDYYSTTIVEARKEYTCKVTIPGYNDIFCSQILPVPTMITNIEHINVAGKDEEGTNYPALEVTFLNDVEESSYYELEVRCINNGYTGVAYIHTIVDPVLLSEGLPIPLFKNDLITDTIYTLHLNYTTNSALYINGVWRTKIYPFVVELRSVSYDYYRFKKQLYLYQQGRMADGITTSMTNANLYSNIENGYGIFAGYSSCVSDTITPNLDGYYD